MISEHLAIGTGSGDFRAVTFRLGCVSQCLVFVKKEKEADLVGLVREIRHFFFKLELHVVLVHSVPWTLGESLWSLQKWFNRPDAGASPGPSWLRPLTGWPQLLCSGQRPLGSPSGLMFCSSFPDLTREPGAKVRMQSPQIRMSKN